jgi:hypothetical protein
MIKGIMGGPGVNVLGGSTTVPYVNQNSSNPMQGMIRIFGSDMQVFDGTAWINLSASYSTVELNGETQAILQWAREERDKQAKRQQLIKDNPALQKAMEAIEKAEANFDILAKFVENDSDRVTI